MIHVYLNVYDVTNTQSEGSNDTIVRINNVTRQLGIGGVFHGGMEIENQEWAFGYCERGTGVYACTPKKNPMYCYRETIDLGATTKTRHEIKEILRSLREAWQGNQYDLLASNCCHFCEAVAKELGVKPVPGWVNRFAQGADATVTFTSDAVAAMRSAGSEISRTCQASANWLRDSWQRVLHTPESTQAAQLSSRSFLWWREPPSRSSSQSPARSEASNPESSPPSFTSSDTPHRGASRSLASRLIPNQPVLPGPSRHKMSDDGEGSQLAACLLPPAIVTTESVARALPPRHPMDHSTNSGGRHQSAGDGSMSFAALTRRAYEAASLLTSSASGSPSVAATPSHPLSIQMVETHNIPKVASMEDYSTCPSSIDLEIEMPDSTVNAATSSEKPPQTSMPAVHGTLRHDIMHI